MSTSTSTTDRERASWLTVDDISDSLGCTRRHVLNMIHRGDLKAYRFGRLYRVQRRDFERALKPVAAGAHGGAA